MVAGTVAIGSLLDSATVTFAGAATLSEIVPVTSTPPGTALIPNDTCWIPRRAIASVASRALPEYGSVAVIVATVGVGVSMVAMANVCADSPAGIVVRAGTIAAWLSLASVTSSPPSGAGADNVSVAATGDPPMV